MHIKQGDNMSDTNIPASVIEENLEAPTVAETVEALASKASEAAEAPKPVEPETPAVEQQDDKFSSKFAALSRKEREVRQREKVLQAERAQFQKLQQENEALKKSREEWENDLRHQLDTDPLGFLEKKGKSYKELTEKFILKEEPTPEQKQLHMMEELRAELAAIRSEQKAKDQEAVKQSEENQKRSAERAQQEFITNLNKHIQSNPDKYELIVKNDAGQLVFDVMDSVYNESKDPDTGESAYKSAEDFDKLRDEAAAEVENYLLEEAMKLVASNKIKQKLAVPAAKEPPKNSATLSNSLAQQTPVQPERLLSEDESKRRMAAMLKYNG